MFYTIQNGQLLTAENIGALANYYDNVQELPLDYEVGKYIVKDNELFLNPNYEAEQKLKERERIAKLFLTGADVERGIYQAKGMDFDDILAFVMAYPPMGLDVKALRIELKANHFYRGNHYVSAVGELLGFTIGQLDKFFEFNDYTYLLPSEEIDETESNTTNEPTDISV